MIATLAALATFALWTVAVAIIVAYCGWRAGRSWEQRLAAQRRERFIAREKELIAKRAAEKREREAARLAAEERQRQAVSGEGWQA